MTPVRARDDPEGREEQRQTVVGAVEDGGHDDGGLGGVEGTPFLTRSLPAGVHAASRAWNTERMRNNPLVDVVRSFPAPARQALHAAATSGPLHRGTWHGCPLNRAGAELGVPVRSRGEAAYVLGVTPEMARSFVEVWDRLWGSNRRRSKLLRDALERAARPVDDAPVDSPAEEPDHAKTLVSCG
jgi:hypothetical protein